ncbi:MAG TPA: Ig-like domain-containing protein [Gemmatimonadales bacterium]|nr:Ig-like domain-containing protein [Gemmatimonadales bacterium]
MTTDRCARAAKLAALLVGGALVGSCSGDTVGPGNDPASVTISPSPASLTSLGAQIQFAAVVRNAAGDELSGVALTWSSSDPAILVQENAGQFRSVANGQVTVTARVTDADPVVEGTAQVVVAQQAATITVTATADTLWAVGATDQWTARQFDALGVELAEPEAVNWSSSNQAVATVSSTGLVTAVGDGTAQITAARGPVATQRPAVVAASIPYTVCVSYSLGGGTSPETCFTVTLTLHAP